MDIWEISVSSIQFCCESKIVLKMKSNKKFKTKEKITKKNKKSII